MASPSTLAPAVVCFEIDARSCVYQIPRKHAILSVVGEHPYLGGGKRPIPLHIAEGADGAWGGCTVAHIFCLTPSTTIRFAFLFMRRDGTTEMRDMVREVTVEAGKGFTVRCTWGQDDLTIEEYGAFDSVEDSSLHMLAPPIEEMSSATGGFAAFVAALPDDWPLPCGVTVAVQKDPGAFGRDQFEDTDQFWVNIDRKWTAQKIKRKDTAVPPNSEFKFQRLYRLLNSFTKTPPEFWRVAPSGELVPSRYAAKDYPKPPDPAQMSSSTTTGTTGTTDSSNSSSHVWFETHDKFMFEGAPSRGDSYRIVSTVHIGGESAVFSVKVHKRKDTHPVLVTPAIAADGLAALGKHVLSHCIEFWELSGAALREHLKDHEGPNEILYRMAHSNYQEERDLVRPVVRFFEALRYEMLHHAPEKAPLRDLWNPEDNLGMTAIDYVCSGPADTHVAKKRRTAHTQQAPPAAAAAGQGAQLDIAINKEESDIDMRGGLTDGEEET
mmetsp:Transcript_13872/g.39919  ORF Transcript_13872/g.39919 Transcript_13872/m.39919 type:complete len:495 (+) Transcript_13872:123-1607(+)